MTKDQEIDGIAGLLEAAAGGLLPRPLGPAAIAGIEYVRGVIEGADDGDAALEAFKAASLADVRAHFNRG